MVKRFKYLQGASLAPIASLRNAQGSWGDTGSYGDARPVSYQSPAAPASVTEFYDPEPPDERSILANALFSGSASTPAPAPAPAPALAPEMDLLMGLDAPSPSPMAPDLLGGFDQLSVGGYAPLNTPGMMMGAQPMGVQPTGMGMGMGMGANVTTGSPQVSGASTGGMAPGAKSSIPAHLRDRTAKKKSDPFADLLG